MSNWEDKGRNFSLLANTAKITDRKEPLVYSLIGVLGTFSLSTGNICLFKGSLQFSVMVTTSVLKESPGCRPRWGSCVSDRLLRQGTNVLCCSIVFFHRTTVKVTDTSENAHYSFMSRTDNFSRKKPFICVYALSVSIIKDLLFKAELVHL